MKTQNVQIEDCFFLFLEDDYYKAEVTKIETEISNNNNKLIEKNIYFLSYFKNGVKKEFSTSDINELLNISDSLFLDINKIDCHKTKNNLFVRRKLITIPL